MQILQQISRLLILGMIPLACLSCGPHMNVQPSIQPYEQQMPRMPAGTIPAGGSLTSFTTKQGNLAANPLKPTPANLRSGQIYYGYYCIMCHGSDGRGNGPVGQSYVPKPTDLTSPVVAGMNDGQIYRGMLYGVGHSPVLDQTVLPNHRWPLVMYVRTFSKTSSAR